LTGWEGVVFGDIPIGAGLSSSAAIEIATLLVFSEISNFPWKPVEMAKMGQLAETDWVGVDSGIMDQMISALAEPGTALLIDCRSLLTQKVAVPPELGIIALDSGIRRDLVTSTYNQRHQECAMAAKELGVKALRDLNYDEFRRVSDQLSDTLRKRALHVITENERTLLGAKALQGGEMTKLGELINESHESLRDDFEVSSIELDTLTNIARSMEGCFGARMTGAGFGGFALALVERDSQGDFIERVTSEYKSITDFDTVAELCEPAKGAEVVYSS
jgi:galactokinase